ncbi:hypothetical protein AB0A05_27305 [Streptomyces sp. NPDC046374]|uniref:hypothetical protein n=1 Tax=Streptomyces sp. NPDC046374 TaxID=3154917 RepID=UPI0034104037
MSAVINARDFSQIVTDPRRDQWNGITMACVVKALAGEPVAITTDTQTGHTALNVVLVRVMGDAVLVQGEGMPQQGIAYPLRSIGMVLPMSREGSDVKWKAIRLYAEQGAAAKKAAADHPKGRAAGRNWGHWKAEGMGEGVFHVTYEPSTGNDFYKDQWGSRASFTVSIAEGREPVATLRTDWTDIDQRRAAADEWREKARKYREAGEEIPAELMTQRPKAPRHRTR